MSGLLSSYIDDQRPDPTDHVKLVVICHLYSGWASEALGYIDPQWELSTALGIWIGRAADHDMCMYAAHIPSFMLLSWRMNLPFSS